MRDWSLVRACDTGSGDASRLGLPPWPEVVDVLAELNNGLRTVADKHRSHIAEIHARFLGHRLAVGNPAQPEPRPDNRALWYCNVIEPKAWGADAVRASFRHAPTPTDRHSDGPRGERLPVAGAPRSPMLPYVLGPTDRPDDLTRTRGSTFRRLRVLTPTPRSGRTWA